MQEGATLAALENWRALPPRDHRAEYRPRPLETILNTQHARGSDGSLILKKSVGKI